MKHVVTHNRSLRAVAVFAFSIAVQGCSDSDSDNIEKTPSQRLSANIEAVNTMGTSAYILPASDDFSRIPQDPNNPITEEKVLLGKLLYHETAIATDGVNAELSETWSCASCHHAGAGFKSGVPQGIGEGGIGFGISGEARTFAPDFDKAAINPAFVPDVQPLTSPTILNSAYQEVMLWNGQFGNMQGGNVNAALPLEVLQPENTPKAENARGLAGLETQAIAGTKVHRLNTFDDSVLQTNDEYVMLFEAAFPEGSKDAIAEAGKAIAAYERTVLANEAPFQKWLRGDDSAMTEQETLGAILFFGKAGCVSCHNGPALSSELGSNEDQMFMAIGFADFDPNNPQITGTVSDADSRGRGGFTGNDRDDFKFKVPQLYNLADSNVFGHGASFTSIRDVVAYKNAAVPQKVIPDSQLDVRFQPLDLTQEEMDQIVAFLETGLYDSALNRYVPDALPTGRCFPVADEQSKLDLNCS